MNRLARPLPGFYIVTMLCSNCGYKWIKAYKQGVQVPTLEWCPNCHCSTEGKIG